MNTLEYHPNVKYNNIRPLPRLLGVQLVFIRKTVISKTFICLFRLILWILCISGQALRSYFEKSGSKVLTPQDTPGT